MNSIFSNEKLGRSVEDLRLHEIRQQVEGQRMAAELRTAWLKRISLHLIMPVQLLIMHIFTR